MSKTLTESALKKAITAGLQAIGLKEEKYQKELHRTVKVGEEAANHLGNGAKGYFAGEGLLSTLYYDLHSLWDQFMEAIDKSLKDQGYALNCQPYNACEIEIFD